MIGEAPQLSIETPRGAPAQGGALEPVMVSATPVHGFLGAEVHVDGTAVASKVRILPEQVAISSWADLRGLPPSLHEVTVAARWEDGAVVETQLLEVVLGQRAEFAVASSADASGIEVARLDAIDLEERLARTALGGAPLVLLDDDCTLAPGALARIKAAFAGRADVVIGDEAAMISETHWIRWRKRALQPEQLPGIDSVGPLLAVGPRAADVLCDALPATAGLYGLVLELLDRRLDTTALPHVLALTGEARLPADTPEARAAVERLAARRGRPVRIGPGAVEGLREVRWPVAELPSVTVVVPSRAPALAARCLTGVAEHTGYAGGLGVVVVDSSPSDGAMEAALAEVPLDITCVRYPPGESFNYQRAVNLGARDAGGDPVLFLNDDVVPVSRDWLERMVELLTLPRVGIVGAFLRHPDGTIQHAGVQIGEGYGHRYHDAPGDARGHRFELLLPGNPEAVTGACMLVRPEVLDEVGGHDESYVHVYGDVDLCFRATARGWRIAWAASAALEHDESASYGSASNPADIERFGTRWRRDRDLFLPRGCAHEPLQRHGHQAVGRPARR